MNSQVVPVRYTTPPFPSLYPLLPPKPTDARYLYYTRDIVRFTVLWTVLFYCGTHVVAGLCAVVVQRRSCILESRG
jgi:hypothetical protein